MKPESTRRCRTVAHLVYVILGCAPMAAQSTVDKAWTVLTTGLAEHSAEHRAKAAHALGLIPGNSKAPELAELVTAISDKKWLVRTAAVDAIAKRGDPALLSAVSPLLTDDHEVVRYNAAAAVIHLSGRSTRSRP